MRAFSNYNNVASYTESMKLPAGAYKIKIIRAEEQPGKNNSCALCILFDIAEGEFANFYHQKFASDKKAYSNDAKYKGVFRLWYPKGNEYDETNERKIKTALERIKESNNLNIDFTKEWDGAALKDCCVGMIFREEEYDYKGRHGFSAQPYGVITLSDLKEGNFTLPETKYLNNSSQAQQTQTSTDYVDMTDDDDDLPF